ncbi:MAG: hypothetical protein IKM70_07445, partial [Firmicutes bacterium]|nr:hypothetical protein [Bacillota bacterium]
MKFGAKAKAFAVLLCLMLVLIPATVQAVGPAFSTQPQDVCVAKGWPCYPTWELNFEPNDVIIQAYELNTPGEWGTLAIATPTTATAYDPDPSANVT